VTDRGIPDPWWGDESPVSTDRPRRNGVADRAAPERREHRPEPEPAGHNPDRHGPDAHRSDYEDPRPDYEERPDGSSPSRSRAQFFVPPPEELPPFEDVVEQLDRGRRRGGPPTGADAAGYAEPAVGRAPEPAPAAIPEADMRDPGADPRPLVADPRPPVRVPDPAELAGGDDGIPDAPVLGRPPRHRQRQPVARPADPAARDVPAAAAPVDRRRLAVVYDVDGPRIRLGVAWFAGAMASMLLPVTAAVAFAVAAGFAGRQIARAWGAVSWHADVAAGLAAIPVLAALAGLPAAIGATVLALVVAVGCALAPDGARLPGGDGRVAAVGILALAVVPAVAGASVVLVRSQSVVAAVVLIVVASAYEVGDYIVGSGASNPLEGPLAGITTTSLVALPLALILVEPYDAAGVSLLAFAAAACPFGQIIASAVLPGAGAYAPALRRIDTLLLLGPVWVAAAGAV
jgi:hypothetical protein